MTLKQQILSDLKSALKSGDKFKRDVLRFLDSALKNAEIEKRKKEEGLTDEEIIEIIARSLKQRRDSIEQYQKGNRLDLAEKEKKELAILSQYMPEQLSPEEIEKAVKKAIIDLQVAGISDRGKVMGKVMGELKGKADGNVVRKVVEKLLNH
jgi:hypothetical protein